jgi:outer membrane protein assembly factor BamD
MKRFALTILVFLAVFSSAEAISIPFIGKKRPIDISPAEQTELARPIYERALDAEQSGHTRRAIRNYNKIFKKYPASDYSAQSLYSIGTLQYKRKKWKKSFSAFQTILIQHPDFPKFNELVEYQFRIAQAHAEGEGIRFLFVFPSTARNASISYFEIVIRNAPYSELAPLALMNVAMIHQYEGNIVLAIDALDRLINNYPGSLLADDAYLSLAETYADLVQGPMYDQGATREAISYFEDFLILFAENEKVKQAEEGLADMEDVYARSKLVIGQYYFKYRRWYQAAEIFFNEAITTAPDSPAADTARAYLAQIESIRANYTPPTPRDPADAKKEQSLISRWMNRFIGKKK